MVFEKFLDLLNGKMDVANDFLYGYFLVIILVATGIYFSYLTRFVQFRMFFEACRVLVEKKDKYNKHHLTPFQALMISTASRVGIGNIAGISAAIVAGGPGALFWMCLMAFLGSASAFIESTLAQIYKTKDVFGFKGGPAYYIKNGLGIKWLASLFAIILIITYAYGFNGLQSYTMTSAFEIYYDKAGSNVSFAQSGLPIGIGLILTAFAAVMFFSKSHIIGKVSSYIVPFMALAYISLALIAIVLNFKEIPDVVKMILENAFDFKAIFGGFAGSVIVIGIKRGLFSNEAGMGSTPHAHAAANVKHPVDQAVLGIMSVFVDTFIVLNITVFVVLTANVISFENGKAAFTGITLVQEAFSSHIFGKAGGYSFVAICLFFFAFTTILGWYYFAEINVRYLFGAKAVRAFQILVVLFVFLGSLQKVNFVWSLADMFNGLMVVPNLIAIILLSPVVARLLKDHDAGKEYDVKEYLK